MKVLFIGVGLTPYFNQVLNKLAEQPGLEVYNLVAPGGARHGGDGVHQTDTGVHFNIVYRRQIQKKKFSDFRYKTYDGLTQLLQELKPSVIVSSEVYLYAFLREEELQNTIKKLGIRIIMKDIPFRMNEYSDAQEKIIKGKFDESYVPFFAYYFDRICQKTGLGFISALFEKFFIYTGIRKVYGKIVGRRVLRAKLEERKKILNFVDAHANYVEDAYRIFATYGVEREKVFITYNSPDTDILFEVRKKIEHEDPILPPNSHRLIHVGRLVEWKRVDLLIRALKEVQKEFEDVELLILGYGPQEKELIELAKELKLENVVRFMGGVYELEVLGKYLMASTVYVLAGMGGISINDAMAFGKPVICSVCDGTEKKLVYEGISGYYFKEGDVHDLAQKITNAFKNPDELSRMSEKATEIIKQDINIHTVIRGYQQAFSFVLKKNNV